MSSALLTRLQDSDYNKTGPSFTDTLTEQQIAEKLEDYVEVADISTVPLGTHMRYFVRPNGQLKFRLGGSLIKINRELGYVVLSANAKTWSVQIPGTTFFRRLGVTDVKNHLEGIIRGLEERIHELESENSQLKKIIKLKS